MRVYSCSIIANIIQNLSAVAAVYLSLALVCGTTSAALVNFDELEYVIIEDGDGDMFYEHPVTDAYLSQGLLINDGYLAQYSKNDPDIISSPNFLIGGEHFRLDFVGTLPSHVSMKVRGINQEAVFFDVYDASGLVFQARTSGDANSPDDPIYIPNEFISFNVPEGIASIEITDYYKRRIVAGLDDLRFEYTPVPEPSGLVLLGIGLFTFACRQHRIRTTIL